MDPTNPATDLDAEGEIDSTLLPGAAGSGGNDSNEDVAGDPELANIWNQGTEQRTKGEPDGKFQALIEDATLGRSASSGRVQIHYKLKVLTGPSSGQSLNKYDGLGSPKQVSITQQQLKRLGIDVDKVDMKKLPAVLLDLKNKTVDCMGKHSGDFYNVNFNKLINADAGDAAPYNPEGADDLFGPSGG